MINGFNSTEKIKVIRKAFSNVIDERGNEEFLITEIEVDALVAPGATSTSRDISRTTLSVDFTLYLPFDFQVEDADSYEIRGELFNKDGDAQDWRTPGGFWQAGTVVEVSRAEG